MKLAILVPTYEKWEPEFGYSLALLMAHLARSDIQGVKLVRCDATNISESRNVLARDAIESEFSHMLWLDTDMKFTATDIQSLIDRDVDFVGVNYLKRNPPHVPLALDLSDKRITEGSGLVRVSQVGFGVVLLKTSIFKKIPEPWFNFLWREGQDDQIGEDTWFCRTAVEKGVELYVDLDVHVGHIGKTIFTWR